MALADSLAWGPGPRAAQALMLAVRARALLTGRLAPGVADVAALARPVLTHRMALGFAARARGESLSAIIERTTPRSIAETLHALADRPDSTPTLATINVPTLVVVGALDALTPIADAMFMRDRIAGAKLAVIQGAGHLPPMEAPADFNLVLDEFLSRG